MKQSFETSKLYYGFPIFILGYQDQTHGYNVTTCSSSYSLGDWLVIGVGSEENAADQIKHYQKFTVNIPDESLMLEMEQAGFISHTQSEHVLIRAHQRRVAAGKRLKDVCGLELKVHKEHFQKDFEGK